MSFKDTYMIRQIHPANKNSQNDRMTGWYDPLIDQSVLVSWPPSQCRSCSGPTLSDPTTPDRRVYIQTHIAAFGSDLFHIQTQYRPFIDTNSNTSCNCSQTHTHTFCHFSDVLILKKKWTVMQQTQSLPMCKHKQEQAVSLTIHSVRWPSTQIHTPLFS